MAWRSQLEEVYIYKVGYFCWWWEGSNTKNGFPCEWSSSFTGKQAEIFSFSFSCLVRSLNSFKYFQSSKVKTCLGGSHLKKEEKLHSHLQRAFIYWWGRELLCKRKAQALNLISCDSHHVGKGHGGKRKPFQLHQTFTLWTESLATHKNDLWPHLHGQNLSLMYIISYVWN